MTQDAPTPHAAASHSLSVLTLVSAAEALVGSNSAEQVAAVVRTAARALSGADGIAVVLREGDKVRYLDEDAVGPLWKGRSFSINECLSGWAMLNRQQAVVPDIDQDPRIPLDLYRPTFVRSCVMTPVGRPDPIACIGAYWKEPRHPTEAELESLDVIARSTAIALENLRLRTSLRQALAQAEESSRAKSNFLTNISHEIRTPLNGVVGSIALLSRTPLTGQQGELVAMAEESGAALEGVLKDVLDFARLQSAEARLELTEFDVPEVVREVARLYELGFATKGVAFTVEVREGAQRRVRGDRGALKQILSTLVHNALKFTADGQVELIVDADEAGADRLKFTLCDTGIGVAPDVRARIFGSFEQADMSATRQAGGLGLGLAIARRLADMMGGSLEVEDRPGGGSAFIAIAPLPPAPLEDVAPASPEEAAPALPADAAERFLVVDDHPTNRILLSALLASVGAKTLEVENGEDACCAAEAERFAAILMDIQMPVMDGLSATRRIRAMEQARGLSPTPIIMVSANALPEHVEASRLAGADRHLAKPISPALLFSTLETALGARAA